MEGEFELGEAIEELAGDLVEEDGAVAVELGGYSDGWDRKREVRVWRRKWWWDLEIFDAVFRVYERKRRRRRGRIRVLERRRRRICHCRQNSEREKEIEIKRQKEVGGILGFWNFLKWKCSLKCGDKKCVTGGGVLRILQGITVEGPTFEKDKITQICLPS